MYNVYDSLGNLMSQGFSTLREASNWKYTWGNSGWQVRKVK